jgi:hypothetical protein
VSAVLPATNAADKLNVGFYLTYSDGRCWLFDDVRLERK